MALQWRDQLSVGNEVIDTDHKYLIEIINKAEISLKANNHYELTAVFDELMRYGKAHFEREELIAKAVNYPKTDQLHASHCKLFTALDKFKEEIGSTWSDVASTHFTTLLRDWLIQHVIKEDLPMKPWMIKHSPLFDPRDQRVQEKKQIQEEDPLFDEVPSVDFDQRSIVNPKNH